MANSGTRGLKIDSADFAIARKLDPLMTLTPPQRRFCAAYVKTGNATQSAKAAGYAEKSASVTGKRLLEREDIQDAVQELWIAETIANGITTDRLVAELGVIAMDRDGERQDRDRLKAIDMLMRYLGAYNDQLKISYDDPDIIDAAQQYGFTPQELVQEMAQLAPIDTDS